ncbi:ABC transporter ATP-binding protein [Hoeflea sp. CAU 1731]
MTEQGAKLKLSGVEKRYGKVEALRPTDLELERGEFFSLIGPSGSGKTTLLGAVAGFTPPTRGRIEVDGVDMAALPPYKREIGMVFQNYALFPHLTVFENIAFPLRLRKLPESEIRSRVIQMLETVRLPDVGGRMPTQLSGGQQQRIALARAAVYGPRILLMDEPLGALDKNLREEMQFEIKEFHAKVGATVLYVTHDQDEAAAMSDRIAIMRQGGIVQVGTPRELYEHPRNEFAACFLGNANLLEVVREIRRSGDYVDVETPAGPVRAIHEGKDTGNGDQVLCVRPESIGIEREGVETSAASTESNRLSGRITDATFTAGSFRYVVDVEGASPVAVRLTSIRQSQMLKPGDRVALQWAADATLMIPKE